MLTMIGSRLDLARPRAVVREFIFEVQQSDVAETFVPRAPNQALNSDARQLRRLVPLRAIALRRRELMSNLVFRH